MKKILLSLCILSIAFPLFADDGPGPRRLQIAEEDGTPADYYDTLKVTNGTLTDNGDGTVSLSIGGTFAPVGATYLTSTANGTLTAEVNLGALSTGLLKGTVAAGVSTISAITDSSTNWDTAYTDRLKWDGGSTGLTAATGRTSLALDIGTNVQAYDADLTTWAGITPGANVGTFLATPSSANLLAAITDETGTGVAVFGTSPTFTTQITTPKIVSAGDLTIDAVNAAATSTVYILNSGGAQVADLNIEGDLVVTDISVITGGTLQLGANGISGLLKIYSEQGATDYIASLYTNTAMTSAASFYLPLDEPAATSIMTMTTGGVITNQSTSAGLYGALSDETGSASGTPLAVFNQAPTIVSPIITNINPGADFTLTNNSVSVLTSVNTGAVVNTLYLKAGNVGIGTTTPAVKFQVMGGDFGLESTRRFGSGLNFGTLTSAADGYINFYSATDGSMTLTTTYAGSAAGGMNFQTGGTTTNMRIDKTGNVGIGTTVPYSLLDASSITGGVLTISRNDATLTAADTIGTINFWTNDTQTTTNPLAAQIIVTAKNTPATDINPGVMKFYTTPTGVAASPTLALTIDEAQLATLSSGATISGTTTVGTLAGTIDAGGATSLEVPNGANPTTDAAGEIAVDSSAAPGSGIRIYGDAAYTIAGTYSKSFCLLNPIATDDYPIWCTPYAITITHVRVQCLGGTNIVGQLTECDAEGINPAVIDSADITATANNSVDDDGTLSNASVDALDYVGWKTESISGTPTSVTVSFDYTINQVN